MGDFSHTKNTNGTVIVDNPGGTPIVNYYNAKDLWFLNLIGLNVGNIDLTDILYDTAGNLQVSGFSIVRTDRIKTIMAQGLTMCAGATATYDPTTSTNNQQLQFHSLPTVFNGYLNTNGSVYSTYTSNYIYVGKAPDRYLGSALPDVNQTLYPSAVYTARPQIAFFESPDYMIDNTILGTSAGGDNMTVVNVCGKAYGSAGLAGQAPLSLQFESFYTKNYRSVIGGYPLIFTEFNSVSGVYDNVVLGQEVDIDEFYPNIQSGAVVYGNIEYSTISPALDYMNWGNKRYLSRQINPTCAFLFGYTPSTNKVVTTFGVLTDDENLNYATGSGSYFITNYIRPSGSYTITQSFLESRIYQNVGHFVPINQDIIDTVIAIPANNGRCIFNNVPVWGGDCFLDYWTYYRLYADLDEVNNDNQDYNIGLSFPIESVFNIAMRQGNTYDRFGGTTADTYNNSGTLFTDGLYYYDETAKKVEDFNVNKVLQAVDTTTKYYPEPSTFNEVYDFPVREQYTGTKIYGEKYDAYRKFPVNNFRDADGSKGQINSLQYIFNYLYIIQENGFARVRFNDREMITGQTGSSLDIGNALGLQGFDYISPTYGTQHQFSVVNSGKSIYWVDAEKGKHLRFSSDGMMSPSDEYGMHNYFTRKLRDYWGYDNPAYAGGIVGVFDFKNQSEYLTFTEIDNGGASETIEYSEATNQYKSFHSFHPVVYMNFKENFFSSDPSSNYKFYAHDEGDKGLIYGIYYLSKIKFVVNPTPVEAKWFDNGSIGINNEVASAKLYSVSAFTENQSTQTIIFGTDNRWKYLQGFVRYPMRGIDADSRLRGKSATVEISVTNDVDNLAVRISSHETDNRLSPKL